MANFTFVVPVYKVPHTFLSQCVDSILNQTHENIELILVDDGSPDDCGRYCDEFASIDKRIRVVHKLNGGLSDARNAGTDLASSPWVTYVDGDDWVERDFVQSFLNRIKQQPTLADFYMYNGFRNHPNKEIICASYYTDGQRFISKEEREELQKECCMVPMRNNGQQLFIGSGCAKVFNLTFLKDNELKFNIVPYGEDSIFFMYSVEKAKIVEYVSKPIYHYRDTEGSMVHGFRTNAVEEQNIYVRELFNFARKYRKDDCFIDALYLRVFISMQRIITQQFFSPKNPLNFFRRWKDCDSCFSKAPYCDIYKHISFWRLNRNSKVKYLLFRFKMYGLLETARNMYFRSKGTITQVRG